MILWIIILVLVLAALCIGLAYLCNRFSKFNFIENIANGSKKRKFLFAVIPVAVIIAVTCISMDFINAIICLLHLALFWLISDLVFLCIKKIRKKSFKRYYAGASAIVMTAAYLSVGWYLLHNVWQTNYNIITDNKSVGHLRVVQFADSHVGTSFSGKELSEYLDRMEQQDPDVILITGDFVDDDTSKEDMIDACEALGNVHTNYGVYFAFGNHDKGYGNYRGYSGDDLIEELEKNNVTVLQDEAVLVNDRFYIVGRKDRSEEQNGSSRLTTEELLAGLDDEKYIIVMDHQPHEYDDQANTEADLVLSGHTHGGQLIPINHVGELIGENDRAYGIEKRTVKNSDGTNFIVTSGISDWAIKFKTGCKSEYVVIDIDSKA